MFEPVSEGCRYPHLLHLRRGHGHLDRHNGCHLRHQAWSTWPRHGLAGRYISAIFDCSMVRPWRIHGVAPVGLAPQFQPLLMQECPGAVAVSFPRTNITTTRSLGASIVEEVCFSLLSLKYLIRQSCSWARGHAEKIYRSLRALTGGLESLGTTDRRRASR